MSETSRSELNEKLKVPFPPPRRFGWIRVWRDESGPSLAFALLAAVLIAIVLLWLNRISDTGLAGVPSVSIEQVVLGEAEEQLDVTNESSGLVALRQATSRSTLTNVEISKPDVQSPAGQLKLDRPEPTFNESEETANVQETVQGLRESIRKLKGEPVELGGAGGISGVLKVDSRYKSVVWVIDRSGSMSASQRLDRVKAELIAGINALEEDRRFSVVFFDDTTLLPFSTSGTPATTSGSIQLLPASDGEKRQVIGWINQITIGGGTEPVPPVMLALQSGPELIVLLSDGEFSDTAVQQITSANKKRTRIDCIGLGEIVTTLYTIAKDNGGRYQPAR